MLIFNLFYPTRQTELKSLNLLTALLIQYQIGWHLAKDLTDDLP